ALVFTDFSRFKSLIINHVSRQWFVVCCRLPVVRWWLSVISSQWSVVRGQRAKSQIPNPKYQAPKKSQASSSKLRCGGSRLEIEIWGIFGIRVLGFGVCITVFGVWFLESSSYLSASTRSMFSVRCWMFDVRLFITQRLLRIAPLGARRREAAA